MCVIGMSNNNTRYIQLLYCVAHMPHMGDVNQKTTCSIITIIIIIIIAPALHACTHMHNSVNCVFFLICYSCKKSGLNRLGKPVSSPCKLLMHDYIIGYNYNYYYTIFQLVCSLCRSQIHGRVADDILTEKDYDRVKCSRFACVAIITKK